MSFKINNIFLFLMIMLCYSCIDTNKTKEIYVVYDNSWTQFGAKKDTMYEYEVKKEEYLLVIKNPYGYKYPRRVYRRPFNRRYWFIGKFLIDKDKNISFVPVTSTKKFKKDSYKKKDQTDIEDICRVTNSRLSVIKNDSFIMPPMKHGVKYRIHYVQIYYYDIEKKEFIRLRKDHPKYAPYFLFGLGHDTPQYLVIKNEYGKQLMENGIILPDPNELKDNIVWQDWYNYWGLTDYKIEIP